MKNIPVLLLSLLAYLASYAQDFTPTSNGKIVKHSFYTLSYLEDKEQAEWVFYELTPDMLNAISAKADRFIPDPDIKTGSACINDYKDSDYVYGQLAPSEDMRISESYYLSNVSPQKELFNKGAWFNLESQVRQWANEEGKLFVVSGPIFDEGKTTIGTNKVAVPASFYKVVYSASNKKMIAFKMPNIEISKITESYLVNVDLLEKETGIDFFSQLPDEIEYELESNINISEWSFNSENFDMPQPDSGSTLTIVQCKGNNTATDKRCQNKTTNENGYCHEHKSQAPDFKEPKK